MTDNIDLDYEAHAGLRGLSNVYHAARDTQPNKAAAKDYMGGDQGLIQQESGAKAAECLGA
jgi:hypothetical protein